jgi:hypothetical protein
MVMLWSSLLLAGLHNMQGLHQHNDRRHSDTHQGEQQQQQQQRRRRSLSSDGSPSSTAATTSAPWQLSVQTGGQMHVIEVTPRQVATAWQGQFVPLVTDIAYLLSAHFHPSTMLVAPHGAAGQAGATLAAASSVADRPEFRAVVTPIVQFLASNACWATLQFVTDSLYGAGASAKALYSAGSGGAAARASSSGAPSIPDTSQQPPSTPASVTNDGSAMDVRSVTNDGSAMDVRSVTNDGSAMDVHSIMETHDAAAAHGGRGAAVQEPCSGSAGAAGPGSAVQEQQGASETEAALPAVADALGLVWRAIKASVRRRSGSSGRGTARGSAT